MQIYIVIENTLGGSSFVAYIHSSLWPPLLPSARSKLFFQGLSNCIIPTWIFQESPRFKINQLVALIIPAKSLLPRRVTYSWALHRGRRSWGHSSADHDAVLSSLSPHLAALSANSCFDNWVSDFLMLPLSPILKFGLRTSAQCSGTTLYFPIVPLVTLCAHPQPSRGLFVSSEGRRHIYLGTLVFPCLTLCLPYS